MHSLFNSGLVSLLFVVSVGAISFNVAGRPRHATPVLYKRNSTPGPSNGSISLQDLLDTIYFCNLTLSGEPFEVSIDTGSADLWIVGNIPAAHNTSIHANLTYGQGSISGFAGFINTATLVFDEFEINDQSYIHADSVIQMVQDVPGTGLIGLGPSKGSAILKLLNSSAGDPPLDRIFKQNSSTPNILTILLSRNEQNSTAPEMSSELVPLLEEQPGQITIGEVIAEYEEITKQPKLPALVDGTGLNQHWMTVLDSNGIIGPDGNRIKTLSTNTNLTQGKNDQLRVVFDSGFSFPQVPASIADAFYGRVPGAFFNQNLSYWQVPCDYELNASFIFANIEICIHPLDMTAFNDVDETTGRDVCLGWFQPIAETIASDPNFGSFDVILGAAFLRNAYLLINFGDFVDESNSSVADPFIQLFSTVNRTAAHLDFVNVRLEGKDTTSTQKPLLPDSEAQTSGENSSNLVTLLDSSDNSGHEPFYRRTWFIIVVSIAGAIMLAVVGWIIYTLTQRTRRSNIRSESAFVPSMGSYKPLLTKDDHSTNGQHNDQSTTGYRDPYTDHPREP
ncbi:acid protease [Lentinula detonsa]|uniref:Acid protease n=1 Tax=Lentinula detonsa TaxID=2804962 RepID=A0AA38PU71_9AGAR|nr:acid protease [Lentinula detonsa]